ncbi:tRNA-modifying protein YgfZ [Jinshanibacter sp. LJY008]|uniref:tRNA-modifying protein YgfZ n=1 Tax=Limnobaculum eriocheiris TaxID=2897391 RepID=A0A9X1SLP4_9GAMM|nr:tRNA-modifying protein YgfZ [Limnobaculum eriocheiris]MCD1127055.1 tRNA-modifying protein YgfZ [Limnobaculum eriocheiris]
MTYKSPLPSQLACPSSNLSLTLISLEDWALVTLSGEDNRKYLQGQLSNDVFVLQPDQHQLTAHCDAKGKMWSAIRLFQYGDALAYLQRSSVCDTQLSELKKYAVFSKVTIEKKSDAVLLGVAGSSARTMLSSFYAALPDASISVVQHGDTCILHFSQPTERFLIVTTQDEANSLYSYLLGKAALNDSRQWLALDIEAGIPVIDNATSDEFIPQATNIQALDGISFTKGCYSGQEMIARAKYRGANKRAMYWLAGKALSLPNTGDDLELQLGENWRRTGTVLASVKLTDSIIWIQAVLNNDLDGDAVLRVKDDVTSHLAIQPLPYSLEEDKA